MIRADIVLIMWGALGLTASLAIAQAQQQQQPAPQCDPACVQIIMNKLQETRDAYLIDAAREKSRADALARENAQLKQELEAARGEKK